MGKGHRSIQKRQKHRQRARKIQDIRTKTQEVLLEDDIQRLMTELNNVEDKYKKVIGDISHFVQNNTSLEADNRLELKNLLELELDKVESERLKDAEIEADRELTQELQELTVRDDMSVDTELESELDELGYSLVDRF